MTESELAEPLGLLGVHVRGNAGPRGGAAATARSAAPVFAPAPPAPRVANRAIGESAIAGGRTGTSWPPSSACPRSTGTSRAAACRAPAAGTAGRRKRATPDTAVASRSRHRLWNKLRRSCSARRKRRKSRRISSTSDSISRSHLISGSRDRGSGRTAARSRRGNGGSNRAEKQASPSAASPTTRRRRW